MTFTDDDLKRLKETRRYRPFDNCWLSGKQWDALLARLEAAEELAKRAYCANPESCLDSDFRPTCDMPELRIKWLRSCGKGEK